MIPQRLSHDYRVNHAVAKYTIDTEADWQPRIAHDTTFSRNTFEHPSFTDRIMLDGIDTQQMNSSTATEPL